MSKKDFSTDTNDVFSSFFSTPSVNTEVKEEKKKTQAKPQKEVKSTKKIIKEETKKEEVEEVKEVEQIQEQEPIVNTKVETKNITQEQTPKTHSKNNRYSFFVNNELNEYVSNITWIKRQKNVATYMNSLIKKDFLEFLNLPAEATDEELISAWNIYKENNNI